MKKFLTALICIVLLFAAGCKNTKETESRQAVTVNMPSDNTVNGYRENDYASNNMPETVLGDNTAIGKLPENQEKSYCANKNTKVFHTLSCSSVENTKPENRVYYSDRDKLINEGFAPCKRCNP